MEDILKLGISGTAKMFKNYIAKEIKRNENALEQLENLEEEAEEDLTLETKEMIYKLSKLHNILIVRLEDIVEVYEEFFEEEKLRKVKKS